MYSGLGDLLIMLLKAKREREERKRCSKDRKERGKEGREGGMKGTDSCPCSSAKAPCGTDRTTAHSTEFGKSSILRLWPETGSRNLGIKLFPNPVQSTLPAPTAMGMSRPIKECAEGNREFYWQQSTESSSEYLSLSNASLERVKKKNVGEENRKVGRMRSPSQSLYRERIVPCAQGT